VGGKKVYQKVDAKHQNQSTLHVEKKKIIVKKQNLLGDCTPKKVILIKLGFACIKRVFSVCPQGK
jgi:hypothetical protein